MTDATPGSDYTTTQVEEPVAPAPVVVAHRPWHHDRATVVVLGLIGGFLAVSFVFGAGWHARVFTERAFDGSGMSMRGGFTHGSMMRGPGPGFDREYGRGGVDGDFDPRDRFAPQGDIGSGCGQGPCGGAGAAPQAPVDPRDGRPRGPRGDWGQ